MTKYQICLLIGEVFGVPTNHVLPDNENSKHGSGATRPDDPRLEGSRLIDLGIKINYVKMEDWFKLHQ